MAALHKIKATAQACTRGSFSLLAAAAMVFAAGAFAQSMDTAYVPFRVNVNATATAQLAGGVKFEKLVRAGSTDTLHIISESTTPISMGKVPKPVAMHSSRGKISLELSRQSYRGVDIALYSLNGKQIMHARADASEALKSISHPNVRMGVYVLSVKGVGGSIFTTRLTHSGGGMNIDVAFANEKFSSGSLMEKALPGNWTITVSAEGHLDTSYAFVPEAGRGKHSVHHITLRQAHHITSSSSAVVPSSSAVAVVPSSSSTEVAPSSSSPEVVPSSSSAEDEPSSSSAVVVVPSSSSTAVASSSSSAEVALSSSSAVVIVPSSSSTVVVLSSSSVAVVLSSSSSVVVPSSSSSEVELSSSSTEDEPSSSSSVPASSSSAEPLACGSVPALGYATIPITPPALACGNGGTATSVRWLGSPAVDWNNPKEGTYSSISVMANCGTAANLMASCPGTLAVRPMISCGMAGIGYEGAAITPMLACSDGSTPFNIVLSGYLPPDLDNPAVGDYAVFAEADCGFGTTPTVFCGTLKVNPATLTCGSVPASGISDVAITPPVLTCDNGKTATDIAWSANAPDWSSPAIGSYNNISVTAACGSVTKTANCGGSLTVNPTLTCGSVPASGFSGFEVTQPVLTCSNGKVATDIAWSANAPNWKNLASGTYNNINVTATCGTSSGLTASCGGSLTVQPVISCSIANTTVYEGVAINQPVLACKNGSAPFGIVFSGSVPNWDNPATGNYEVLAVADCGLGISPAVSCGTLAVNPATLTCGSVPASGISDVAITPPALTCNNGKTATNITWSANAPDWSSPVSGTYSGISVTADCGSVTKTASCGGSLTVSPATLTCGSVPANGFSGFEITSPVLTCNNGKTATDVAWSANAPDWSSPATGTYSGISATATCGTSSGLTANCGGSLMVQPVISCSMANTTVYEGVTINQPVLACKNGSKPSGIIFSVNGIDWQNFHIFFGAGDYEVFAVADCGQGISPKVSCGTLVVSEVTLTCGSVPTSGISDVEITQPTFTCNNGIPANFTLWENAPNWSSPVSGTYNNISVTATCGTSSGLKANCPGSLTVNPATLTCGSVPAGIRMPSGFGITPPALTCNNGITATDIAWSGAPNWKNLASGTYNNINVTATCGTSSGLKANCSGSLSICSGNDNTSTHYCSNGTMKAYGSVSYNGQTYKTVVIGTQTWMAENLNYNASGSKCYGNLESNCNTYGRLYDWSTAMNFASNSSCNSSTCSSQIQTKHKGICPSGWHIPSDAEWTTLTDHVVGYGGYLKAVSGWDYDGYDYYGFSALPGGHGHSSGSFDKVGYYGEWWSATEYNANGAYGRNMGYGSVNDVKMVISDKSFLLHSVRCVQD